MAATSIFIDGRRIPVPGVYSRLDPTGLEVQGLSAAGILALIGTGKGTLPPVTEITDGQDLANRALVNRPRQARELLTEGALLDGSRFAFEPSLDEAISGGAQQIFLLRVDPSTRSTLQLLDSLSNAVIDLATVEYGADSNSVNIQVQTGTTQGKLITIVDGTESEVLDDVGGDTIFTLQYTEPMGDQAPGWDSMTLAIDAANITAAGARAESGLDGDHLSIGTSDSGIATVESSAAGDTAIDVIVYGLAGGGIPTKQRVTVNGTTPVPVGSVNWDANGIKGLAIVGSTAAVGTITVDDSAATAILSVAPGSFSSGGVRASAMFVAAEALTLTSSAGTPNVQVFGTSTTGAALAEEVTTGTGGVATAASSWASIEFLALVDVPAATTITTTGSAAKTVHTTQNTLLKVADYFNARQVPNVATPANPFGFVFTIETGITTLDPAELDHTASPINVDNPATGSFTADLFFVIEAINAGSQLVTATKVTGAGQPPANLGSAQFLTGGIDGVPTTTEYTKALDLLTQVRVNTIVPLTTDAGVHEQVRAHCEYMAGIGRNERDAKVGLKGVTALATKAEIKSKIVAVNSRHVAAVAQAVDRFDVDNIQTTYDPQFFAAIVAGMQAGSPVGEPLTFKQVNALGFSQATDWDPVNDAAELIDAGLTFLENQDGVGRRIVRAVTTKLGTNNIAFIEQSANEAVNFTVFNVRTNLEGLVGKKGLAPNVNQARANVLATTSQLIKEQVLVAAAKPELELIFDVLEVALAVAPVLPINFVVPTIHLSTAQAITQGQ